MPLGPIDDTDDADSPSIGSRNGNSAAYAAGGVLTLGVVAAFLFGNNHSSDFIAADPPADPGSNNDTPDSIGDPQDPPTNQPVNPPTNQPTNPPTDEPGALPDQPAGPTTVTPEPDALILLATGLSGMGAFSFRRRRRVIR